MTARRIIRRAVVGALVVAVVFAIPATGGPATVEWRLARTARSESFNLWTWEARTLVGRLGATLISPAPSDRPQTVLHYIKISQEVNRIRAERDRLWAQRSVTGSAVNLSAIQQQLSEREAQQASLRPIAEATISREIEDELRRQGIPAGQVGWTRIGGFPFLRPSIVPGVFFQLGPLPDLLVVAPIDRIELIGSVLIRGDLGPSEIDRLEERADGLNLASVVTDIGGLAAYPSMLPDNGSAEDLLISVAHEWTHHYLTFQPLGQAYFNSYKMRELNETTADIVGQEIGRAVADSLYQQTPSSSVGASPAAPTGRPSFRARMGQIRTSVEAYLARHDVAGAQAYMAAQRQALAREGWYVRRLNTAYLSFYGSYSGSGNPVENRLQRLRAQSGTLREFLARVSSISRPEDLDRLLARPR